MCVCVCVCEMSSSGIIVGRMVGFKFRVVNRVGNRDLICLHAGQSPLEE